MTGETTMNAYLYSGVCMAAAGGLELAGSVAALVLAMPLFSAVLKMIEGLLT